MWSHRLMPLIKSAENTDQNHPFGGCNRLLEQYRMIGRGLLAYENRACAPLIPTQRGLKDFAAAVAFVPVEVLETYLDDLLDLGVSDESLFIKRPKTCWGGRALLLVLAVALGGAILVALGSLKSAFMPALLGITFMAGMASTLYFLPRTKAIRRFSFATVVSREIGQRRGQDRGEVGNLASRFLMGDMWKLNDYTASRSIGISASRRYFH